jgi:hypothetical protein
MEQQTTSGIPLRFPCSNKSSFGLFFFSSFGVITNTDKKKALRNSEGLFYVENFAQMSAHLGIPKVTTHHLAEFFHHRAKLSLFLKSCKWFSKKSRGIDP